MNRLPPGWLEASVSELADIRLGKMLDKAKNTGELTPYLRNINVRWFGFDLSDLKELPISESERGQLSIQDGDLLICEGGEPGRCAVWRGGTINLTYQKALHRVRTYPGVVPELLMYQLKAEAVAGRLEKAFTGTTIKHLTGESLARYRVVLPPTPEQQRLRTKLGSLLSKVKSCRAHLDCLSQILKRFREAVLEAAVSGRLTEEWRERRSDRTSYSNFDVENETVFTDYTIPSSWGSACLSDVADVVGGITRDSKKQASAGEDLPYLRVANVQRGYLDLHEMKTIRVPSERVAGLLLQRGDILFTEGGDLDKLGRGWIWNSEIERCTFQNHIFRARLNNQTFVPKFFSYFANSRGYAYFLSKGKQTTNLASINKSVLSALPVPIPPAEEQAEICRRVEELFMFAGNLQRFYEAALLRLDNVVPALLCRAFRGELVPQDPEDESAMKLLERIRKEKMNEGAIPTQAEKAAGGAAKSEALKRPEQKVIRRKVQKVAARSSSVGTRGSVSRK